ncbi:hypothetical protein ABZP36_022510 [Zizania latifolia]
MVTARAAPARERRSAAAAGRSRTLFPAAIYVDASTTPAATQGRPPTDPQSLPPSRRPSPDPLDRARAAGCLRSAASAGSVGLLVVSGTHTEDYLELLDKRSKIGSERNDSR